MARTQKRPTIYDIAAAAGVSHMTVSRYLRFQGAGVSDELATRVGEAIDELGYRPNLVARAMRGSHSGRLAIVFPFGDAVSSLAMLSGAREAALGAGYKVDGITLTGSSVERSARVLELVDAGIFEGLLSFARLTPKTEAQISAQAFPAVVGEEFDDAMRGIGDLADASPIIEIMESLVSQGHHTFLFIAGDRAHTTVRARERAFQQTIQRLHLGSAGAVGGDWLPETARQAILQLPEETSVTAVLASNDALAAGAIRGATERGWAVPDDVSISGWDNKPVGAWIPPRLTSVSVDYDEVGRRAMARLLARMRGEPAPAHPEEPVSHVVWRDSTGPVPVRASSGDGRG